MSGGTAQDDYRAAISAQRYQADNPPDVAPVGGDLGRTDDGREIVSLGMVSGEPPRDLSWGPLYAAAIEDIAVEAKSARRKFAPFNSAHEGWAVMFEELDECWDEVRANNHERAIAEAIQVGAMAVRFVADMRAKGYGL